MGKRLRSAIVAVVMLVLLLAVGFWFVVGTRAGQDLALAQTARAIFRDTPPDSFEGLRVFLCGTASPLVAPGRAQACVAVTAGDSLYLVDAGTGSAATMQLAREPTHHLRAILVTHFHSDHITGIPDFNLGSWVAGRSAPLRIVGPGGVERVVAGFNEAYALDRGYRIAHHGEELLPPALGAMHAEPVAPGVVVDEDGLTITAFAVDHRPVAPAYGYRFDYGGRSVVVSGDTVVVASLESAAKDADLLLHDVLSTPIVQALATAAREAGIRAAKIFEDIPSYHAPAAELGALADRAGVRMLGLYHFVPAPRNFLMERMYRRDLPGDAVLTEDGTVFELPTGSTAIHVRAP